MSKDRMRKTQHGCAKLGKFESERLDENGKMKIGSIVHRKKISDSYFKGKRIFAIWVVFPFVLQISHETVSL